MKTLIVIIMDESGSMAPKILDVIGGFNEFINGQKEITADIASAIFIKFNTTVTVVHDAKPIDETGELSPINYRPVGQTALFDAIWDGVRLGEKKEAEFDRVICLIMTDGEENASRKITSARIRNLLKIKEDEGKWTFLYIGENPERWATQTGISTGNVAQYNHSAPRQNFHSTIQAVSTFRNEPMVQQQQLMQRVQSMPPVAYPPMPMSRMPVPITDGRWRNQHDRQAMVTLIEKAIAANGSASTKRAHDMENEIFLVAKDKFEYHGSIVRLISDVKHQGDVRREQMMREQESQRRLLTQLTNLTGPASGNSVGVAPTYLMVGQNQTNGDNSQQQSDVPGVPGFVPMANRDMLAAGGATRPLTPPPPYSEFAKM